MNQVAAGGRLVLHVAGRQVVLRALSPVPLDGDWTIPVLASVSALLAGTGSVELPTRVGVLRCEAHLSTESGSLLLRRGPGNGAAALPPAGNAAAQPQLHQRRQDVRGPVNLPLRGAVLGRPAPAVPGPITPGPITPGPITPGPITPGPITPGPATPASDASAPVSRDGGDLEEDRLEVGFEGTTRSVSAGGLGLLLAPDAGTVTAGSRLYLELELPDGPLIPAVLTVVRLRREYVHAQFLDISAADRERLVRLVFAEERRQLARQREGGAHPR